MTEYYYLYAIIQRPSQPAPARQGETNGARLANLALIGVDPRFAIELLPAGHVAGVASRVGSDRFDTAKLEAGTTDLAWLGRVAVAHNTVVAQLAARGPVLPLRMGTLFQSRPSLVERLHQYEPSAADFLRRLGDCQEWAVKVYRTKPADARDADGGHRAQLGRSVPATLADSTRCQGKPSARAPSTIYHLPPTTSHLPPASSSAGAQYLKARRMECQERRESSAAARQELLTLEGRLAPECCAWRRLRPLSATLSGREEQMAWNGAFLVSRADGRRFHTACDALRDELDRKGLLLEATGPWPPYSFVEAAQGGEMIG